MNTRLANFMIYVASDPDRLAAFNNPSGRSTLIANGDLSDEDKTALNSGDASAVLEQLNAGPEEVSWVVAPGGSTGFVMAFGIKIPGTPLTGGRVSRTTTGGGKKTAKRSVKSTKRGAAKKAKRPSKSRK